MKTDIYQAVDTYISTLFSDHDEILHATERTIAEAGMPHISVSPSQGKLLHMLALLGRAKRILEVGTLGGYSTIWLARALPPRGRLVTIELDEKHARVARENLTRAGVGSRVEIRIGNALKVLPRLKAEKQPPFDMIFIDADKAPYAQYFKLALGLSRPGTLIIADNVIRGGKVLDHHDGDESVAGVRRFNDTLAAHPGVTATILQTMGVKGHDGMALAIVNRASRSRKR